MRKHIVQWSILLLSLSLLRIIAPPIVFSFGGLDLAFAVYGVAVSVLAVLFTSDVWSNIDFRPLLRAGALFSFGFLLLCLYTPTLGNLRQTYVSFLDLFVLLESAVIFGVAAMEEREESLSVLTAIPFAIQLFIRRHRSQGSQSHRLHGAHS